MLNYVQPQQIDRPQF